MYVHVIIFFLRAAPRGPNVLWCLSDVALGFLIFMEQAFGAALTEGRGLLVGYIVYSIRE